jgi:hypothetical protein
MKYKRIDLRTVAGFKQAERLQAYGWTVASSGLDSVLMQKKTAVKRIVSEVKKTVEVK